MNIPQSKITEWWSRLSPELREELRLEAGFSKKLIEFVDLVQIASEKSWNKVREEIRYYSVNDSREDNRGYEHSFSFYSNANLFQEAQCWLEVLISDGLNSFGVDYLNTKGFYLVQQVVYVNSSGREQADGFISLITEKIEDLEVEREEVLREFETKLENYKYILEVQEQGKESKERMQTFLSCYELMNGVPNGKE